MNALPTTTDRLRRRLSLGAIVAVTALVAACGNGGSSEPEPTTPQSPQETSAAPEDEATSTEPTELRFAASLFDTIPYYTIIKVANDKGWFEEEGVLLTLIDTAGGGGDPSRLLSSGAADVSSSGPDAQYKMATSAGTNAVIIAPWYFHTNTVWTSPKADLDLKGARMGITAAGSTGEVVLDAVLAARPDLNFEKVVVPGLGAQWVAAQADRLDGAYTPYPFAQGPISEGAHIVLDPIDIIGEMPMNLVAVDRAYAEANTATVHGFWRAIGRAFEYLRTDTRAAVEDMAQYIEMDVDLLHDAVLAEMEYESAYTMEVDCDITRNLGVQMKAAGLITEDIDWNELLHQEFLPEQYRCAEFE